jgi:hypothetical protein
MGRKGSFEQRTRAEVERIKGEKVAEGGKSRISLERSRNCGR